MFLQTRAKAHFARAIQERGLTVFDLDSHLDDLSAELHALLAPDFADYGMALRHFMVTAVVRPDGDAAYERLKGLFARQYTDVRDAQIRQQVEVIEQETEAKKTVIEAQAAATKRATEGYTYQQERGFDVAQRMAANEAVGEFTNLGIGMGMVTGVGGPVAGMVGGAVADAVSSVGGAGAGETVVGAASAPAQPAASAAPDPVESLKQLKAMLDAGLIPQDAYNAKMNEILGRM